MILNFKLGGLSLVFCWLTSEKFVMGWLFLFVAVFGLFKEYLGNSSKILRFTFGFISFIDLFKLFLRDTLLSLSTWNVCDLIDFSFSLFCSWLSNSMTSFCLFLRPRTLRLLLFRFLTPWVTTLRLQVWIIFTLCYSYFAALEVIDDLFSSGNSYLICYHVRPYPIPLCFFLKITTTILLKLFS